MYYLFKKGAELEEYKKEFQLASSAIKEGVTPVFSEMRSAKSQMVESIPYNILNAVLLVGVTYLLSWIEIPTMLSVAVALVISNVAGATSNFIFTVLKHKIRIRLCKRMGIEATEHNIAVMESLEYQSVITEGL